MSRATNICFSIFLAASFVGNIPAFANEIRGVSAELKIMVPPDIAYAALRASRDEDPEGCKIISTSETECVVEELFDGLPVIGKTTCTYRETYDPQKVSYKMISSDKLKAFEGEWTLTPADEGQSTVVRLRSYIDTGLRIPFARKITDMGTSCEVKQHLSDLKKSAEKRLKRVARAKNQST